MPNQNNVEQLVIASETFQDNLQTIPSRGVVYLILASRLLDLLNLETVRPV